MMVIDTFIRQKDSLNNPDNQIWNFRVIDPTNFFWVNLGSGNTSKTYPYLAELSHEISHQQSTLSKHAKSFSIDPSQKDFMKILKDEEYYFTSLLKTPNDFLSLKSLQTSSISLLQELFTINLKDFFQSSKNHKSNIENQVFLLKEQLNLNLKRMQKIFKTHIDYDDLMYVITFCKFD